MQTEKKHDTSDREIFVSKLLSAPRELVWEVWTNPRHIEKWWGPEGFTSTISVMEVEPGGAWELVLHGPDGTDYRNKSVFTEVVRPERIVFEHLSVPKFTATVEFIAEGDQTLLNWRMLFETREEFEKVVKTFKADDGLKQNVEKLARYLTQPESADISKNTKDQPIVIERQFKAPVAKVWQAITDKDEMKKWYFDLPEFKAEVGFAFEFTGGPSDGKQYRHLCEITEVIPEKRLTYSWRYDGYAGNSFVTFELSEKNGGTDLRLTHTGIETFPKENPDLAKENFVDGWNQIVDTSLRGYLEPAETV